MSERRIIDAPVERLGFGAVIERLDRFGAEIVGLTATTNFFHSAVRMARTVKEHRSETPVVLGGPHLTANPEHAMGFDCFDVGVLKEGELTLIELVEAFSGRPELAKIKGIVFRGPDGLRHTPPREPIKDLDWLPLPARHLLRNELYVPQPNDERVLPKIAMITSRGCPYGCIFCDKSVFGRTYRAHSPERVLDEVEHLMETYGARDIAFVDSTFTVRRDRVERIVDLMRERGVKISWTCTARANMVTKPLLKKMKDAGCWRIRLGVESGNNEVLKLIGKSITTEQVRNAAVWADEVGMQPKGFFMVGHLNDTAETIEQTIRFAKSLPLKDVTVQINTPMYGTPQHKIYRQYGHLASPKFEDMSYWEPSFIPHGLTEHELTEAHRRFYREFYLRPIVVWRHLRHIRSFRAVFRYLRSLKLLFHLFFQTALEKDKIPEDTGTEETFRRFEPAEP